jgi:Protein of unknown function (DUF2905)
MSDIGKFLIIAGAALLALGVVLILLSKTNLPIGRLPGDILYRGKHSTIYFPLATCILLSAILSAALYIISRFKR